MAFVLPAPGRTASMKVLGDKGLSARLRTLGEAVWASRAGRWIVALLLALLADRVG